MQLNLKPYLVILFSVVFLFIVFGLLRTFVFEKQAAGWTSRNQGLIKGFVMTGFFLFAAVLIPVLLHFFLRLQFRIGNDQLPLVKLLSRHAMHLVYAVWILFALGIFVALPVMIRQGLLSNNQ